MVHAFHRDWVSVRSALSVQGINMRRGVMTA